MDELDLGATIRGFSVNQKVFGRYTLKKILGRGGMGVVWLARDEELEHEIALKFLPELVSADKEAVRDLKRETRRSLELTHPHIVRIYDFIQDSQAVAIAMEFIAGDTLASRKVDQAKGFFEARELDGWMRNALAALDYAHTKAQIVHRDLKPANLMVDAAGDLKIADFGISASVSDSVSRVSAQVGSSGTPVYMSPQQMMGEKPAVTDDIYSLGATLFDLLTGKPPFYAGNILRQVEVKVAPSMAERRKELGGGVGDEIPAVWEEAVAACLAKNPTERPQSVSELAVRLGLSSGIISKTVTAPAPEDVTSAAPVPDLSQTLQTPNEATQVLAKPRKSGWLFFAIALVIVVLGGGGYFFQLRMQAQKRRDELTRAEVKARADAEAEAAARGGINVQTEPAGAEVTVGDLAPTMAPFTSKDLRVGPVKVTARMAGYEERAETVQVKKGEESKLLLKLAHSEGEVEITSEPIGIPYVLAGLGTNRNGQTPATEARLPVGDYKVVFRRRGWAEQTRDVAVRRGEKVAARAEFVAGLVRILSEPSGATVYAANGRKIGVTPMVVPEVPPGAVDVTLRLEGYELQALRGEVTSNQTTELKGTLAKAKSELPAIRLAERQPDAETPGVPSSAPLPAASALGKAPEFGQRWTIPDLEAEMIPIQPGTFIMDYVDFVPVHLSSPREVKLTKRYWLGKTEVTLGQWKIFAEATHFKSKSEDGSGLDAYLNNQWVKLPGTSWRDPKFLTSEQSDDSPVVGVSWEEVQQFLSWLNNNERKAGRLPNGYHYSLPTEAQWEFGAHGAPGDGAPPSTADAWLLANGNYTTHAVGSLKPNSRGLYDMYGNAWEWCQDLFDAKLSGGRVTDPVGPPAGTLPLYVTRGAGWTDPPNNYHLRGGFIPILRTANLGFRLALVPTR